MSVTIFPPVLGYTARGGSRKPVTGPGPFFGGGVLVLPLPLFALFPPFPTLVLRGGAGVSSPSAHLPQGSLGHGGAPWSRHEFEKEKGKLFENVKLTFPVDFFP